MSSALEGSGSSEQSHGDAEFIGPALPPPSSTGVITPEEWFERSLTGRRSSLPSTLRHVQRVSQRAALATKKQIWDSNDASIVAAQSAVDNVEQLYNFLRGLLLATGNSARGLYGAAKAGATGLEHGFLLPVRDWILLPAFVGVERVAGETVGFLQSEHAEQVAHHSLNLARQVPFVGEHFLAPALCIGADALKRTWEIAINPIPSPHQVRDSVDFVMTRTKWALSTTAREIALYIKRADANITRTLSHTQWKVLGSGPYATLDKLNKREVIDHLCERYFSLVDAVARYELAAHIRVHNRTLYHDLVLTGLLRERGGDLTLEDEWLSSCPAYRSLESPFLLSEDASVQRAHDSGDAYPLWFRQPSNGGKRTTKEPWVCFNREERQKLEAHYHSVLAKFKNNQGVPSGYETQCPQPVENRQKYGTNAKWYDPDMDNDLFLDQKRHAVSFFLSCPKCKRRHNNVQPPRLPKQFGELCDSCSERDMDAPWVDALLSPPPVTALHRPTMWRFYGRGDELRRATWFLDTQRQGLQPYGEDAQAILEDAYLFLKWMARRRVWDGSILLTVQVPSPDGSEHQLVQFSSLNSATAIGKGLGGAIALFKRRVYRGAFQPLASDPLSDSQETGIDERVGTEGTKLAASSEAAGSDDERNVDNLDQSGQETSKDRTQKSETESSSNKKEKITQDESTQEEHVEGDSSDPDSDASVQHDFAAVGDSLHDHLCLAYPFGEPIAPDHEKKHISDDDGANDVDHLVLIVHGVGEMMQSIDLFGLSKLPTIVDCCDFLRKNHAEVLAVRFHQLYQSMDGMQQPRRGRVEYLPIEWHESFSIQSQRRLLSSVDITNPRGFTINDVSLRTIPQLRQFANDTLMDVLYFMSPEHHDIIIDIVVNEMNFVVNKYRRLTGFTGEISLVGHSLGSIITWDILDNQRIVATPSASLSRGDDQNEQFGSSSPRNRAVTSPEPSLPETSLPEVINSEQNSQSEPIESEEVHSPTATDSHISVMEREAPESSTPLSEESTRVPYPQLDFQVDNTFMLGSPIAVFLMLRNQRKPLSPDFTLSGCSRIFNIFHPYDPVAYRIEPLIDPVNAEIEPKIMTHWHGGLRFQYKTKRIWRMIVEQTLKTQDTVLESLESGIAALGLFDDVDGDGEGIESPESASNFSNSNHGNYVVTGSLNGGRRIDHMLQEKEIENANEYVAALAAHSCYWLEKDLSLFIARQICLRALERETGNQALFRHNSFL